MYSFHRARSGRAPLVQIFNTSTARRLRRSDTRVLCSKRTHACVARLGQRDETNVGWTARAAPPRVQRLPLPCTAKRNFDPSRQGAWRRERAAASRHLDAELRAAPVPALRVVPGDGVPGCDGEWQGSARGRQGAALGGGVARCRLTGSCCPCGGGSTTGWGGSASSSWPG
jgi:hypothetical protein